MKDPNDTATIGALATRGKGRPRQYSNAAERQRAYRERAAAQKLDMDFVTALAREQLIAIRKRLDETLRWNRAQELHAEAGGIYQLWFAIAMSAKASEVEHSIMRARMDDIREEAFKSNRV